MPITINGTGPVDGITSINTSVSSTELGYLDGVTSGIQSQINTSGGLVKIVDNTFSASSAVNINNCFSSTYDSYRIMIDLTAMSTALDISMRLRVGGADDSTANYDRQYIYGSGSTAAAALVATQTSWAIASSNAANAGNMKTSLDIFAPNLARRTHVNQVKGEVDAAGNQYAITGYLLFRAATVFDGFSLLPSTGNISGTVRVYGYRN